MFNLNAYIRIVFSSLMLLPVIILGYFTVHVSEGSDCLATYLKNKPDLATKLIDWPDKGLLTIWFDGDFFIKHKQKIMALMNKYQIPGVLSLSNNKNCYAQGLSISQLIKLQEQGWEVSIKNTFASGQQAINDMPAPDRTKLVINDLSIRNNELTLTKHLKETSVRNGWMILYFHTNNDVPAEQLISMSQLDHILQMVRQSGIPVVLGEQVLMVSQ
jgi:hypothetical protein